MNANLSNLKANLAQVFAANKTALAAAINEVLAVEQYPGVLEAINALYPSMNPLESLEAHAVRRGQLWA